MTNLSIARTTFDPFSFKSIKSIKYYSPNITFLMETRRNYYLSFVHLRSDVISRYSRARERRRRSKTRRGLNNLLIFPFFQPWLSVDSILPDKHERNISSPWIQRGNSTLQGSFANGGVQSCFFLLGSFPSAEEVHWRSSYLPYKYPRVILRDDSRLDDVTRK